MTPRIEIRPARPAERVLVLMQCWHCGRKWAPSPLPDHDRVVVEEGICRDGCEMEAAFFGWKWEP